MFSESEQNRTFLSLHPQQNERNRKLLWSLTQFNSLFSSVIGFGSLWHKRKRTTVQEQHWHTVNACLLLSQSDAEGKFMLCIHRVITEIPSTLSTIPTISVQEVSLSLEHDMYLADVW